MAKSNRIKSFFREIWFFFKTIVSGAVDDEELEPAKKKARKKK